MPWSPGDAAKHDKDANTPAKKKQWAAVANNVLRTTGNDARAIRAASAAVTKNVKPKPKKKGK